MQSALFFFLTCALTLGACSDRDPVSANQPTEAAAKRRISSITWTTTPVAGLAESRIPSLGVVEVSAGGAVQIRSLLSITGASSLGASLHNGIELAVRDFGDIRGYAIDLGESLDSRCSPEGGSAGAEQISADAQVLGVIGTSCSAAAVAASPLISEAGLVMIGPSNTSPLLTSDLAGNANPNYHPGYFRVSNNDLYQAQAVADFAYGELGLRRMAAIHDGDPYTTALVSAFDDAFSALGGEIAATAGIDKGATDMTAVLAEFAAAGPDGLFFPLFRAEGSHFAEQARAFDGLEGATFITGAAMLVSEFLATPQSEDTYFAGPESDHGANVNAATGKNADEILAAYEATYGGLPTSPYWAQAYDATTVLLSAIKSVAVEQDGKLYIDRAALRAGVGATAGFQGIIGAISCDDFGDCGTGRINIY
ncbi:MAG: branched-chain amino acid ABC transporter substrate-binding protein, partial [Candidatus Latescibacteria bacterium]|nr:branched-chain amino acid ABC transporter substrate-binding protein [Candidatus Latescibacterota bacterium]